ncbi:MAG TPA: M20/M25/M40 family metallo-hydrolase [Candidatus Moranbacteria bacterium]|nr:M20/M25/M40 family metallo-hydrolase [Candidatus Moranbacteria bacterium]
MTPIEKLLLDLIKIPSVSGQEKEIGNFLVSRLNGFKVRKQYIDKEIFNVIAEKGKSDIWIVAHMDTVPGSVPIKMTKDKIYGRGAVDNKASIAGAIMAGRKLKDINLLFTVSEEKDFSGAKKAQKIIGKEKAIVMEATGFEIYNSQRGVIGFTVRAKVKQKHSSLIEDKNESAFHNLIDALNLMMHKNWTAFNVGLMNGGVAINVVAGEAEAHVSVRPDDDKEYDEIKKYLKELKARKNIVIKIINDIKPFTSKLGIKGKRKKAFTEMAFFPNSFLFGAGNMDVAHSANEYISRKELNKLEKELLKAVNKLHIYH